MAFSIGNLIKAAASTGLKAVAPVLSTAANVAKSVQSGISTLLKPSAPASSGSNLFATTGQPVDKGFVTNTALPSVPTASAPVPAFTVPSPLPKSTTPVQAPNPSSGPSLAYTPPPTVPNTISSSVLLQPNNFSTVPPPPTPTPYAAPSFTPSPTATPGATGSPSAGGAPTISTPGSDGTPSAGGTPSPSSAFEMPAEVSDAGIRATQGKILDAQGRLAGKGAAQIAAEAKARIPEQQQELNNVINQINTLNADAVAQQVAIEGKTISNVFQKRQIGAVERDRTVRVLGLSAVASALQGNIALARDYATKAVEAQFAPIQAELDTLKQQLDFNEKNFTREEKARAEKLTVALAERERALTEQREQKQQINEIALEAAKSGAGAEVLNGILAATDLATALGLARGELAKKNGIGIYNLSEAQANIASKLADDFEKASGSFSQVRDAYGRIQAAQQGTGISDTALIFAYMKMLDPGSVVREGEFATVANAGGIPAQVMNAYNKAINGDKLPPEIRQQVLSTSGQLYEKALSTQNNITSQFNSRATAYGIPNDLVTRDLTAGVNGGGATGANRDQVVARLRSLYPGVDDTRLNSVADQFMSNPSRLSELGFNQDLGTSQNGLGGLSARYESSGNPGAIGYDSTGGFSYGTYQLAHNNAQTFVQQSPYAREFAGIPFNSQAFQNKWKEIAARDPAGFEKAQHDFIQKTHFEPQAQLLQSGGVNVQAQSPVIQDAIWSTAVQHGPSTPIVLNALRQVGPNASDADKLKAIYALRWNNGKNFASSTPEVQRSVYNRFFGQNGELALALSRIQGNNMA